MSTRSLIRGGDVAGMGLRACLKSERGPVFAEKAGWRGATKEHTRQRSVTEEQRSQPAFSAKTLRAAALLGVLFVGSAVTARYGDAPASPPRSRPKSLAAGPHSLFRRALSARHQEVGVTLSRDWTSMEKRPLSNPRHNLTDEYLPEFNPRLLHLRLWIVDRRWIPPTHDPRRDLRVPSAGQRAAPRLVGSRRHQRLDHHLPGCGRRRIRRSQSPRRWCRRPSRSPTSCRPPRAAPAASARPARRPAPARGRARYGRWMRLPAAWQPAALQLAWLTIAVIALSVLGHRLALARTGSVIGVSR